jgi:hypothetical protein
MIGPLDKVLENKTSRQGRLTWKDMEERSSGHVQSGFIFVSSVANVDAHLPLSLFS